MPNIFAPISRIKGASPYAGTASSMVPGGGGAVDIYNRDAAPSALRLVRENLGTAFACASLNAQLVAKTKLRLYVKTRKGEGKSRLSRSGKTKAVSNDRFAALQKNAGVSVSDTQDLEEVTDHPALSLLQKPNPKMGKNDGAGMSLFTLIETTQLFQETVGRCYWWAEMGTWKVDGKSVGKTPIQLWVLAPQYVTEWPGTGENAPIIEYYQFALGTGTPNYYDPDEVVPFRMIDLSTGGYTGGMSPLRACYEQARLARFADAQLSARVQNGGKPDALFIPKGDEFGGTIGRDEAARLELQLRNRYRMAGAGSIMVSDLPGSLEPITWPLNDVIDAARYDLTRKQIAETYHVPMTKLNRDTSNRASANSGDYAHANDAGLPRLRRNEAAINTFLLPMYGDEAAERLFFAFDDPPGLNDPEQELERFKVVVNTSWTTNEKRAMTGAKELPNGDTILVAGTMTILDPTGSPVPIAKPGGSEDAPKDGEPNANAGAAAASGNPPQPKPKKSRRSEVLLAKALDRLADILQKDDSTEARDENGEWTSGGGLGAAGKKKPKEPKHSEKSKSQIAKQSASRTDIRSQTYTKVHAEIGFGRDIGGTTSPDSQPVDAISGGDVKKEDRIGVDEFGKAKPEHGVELKTVTSNKESKLTMDRYSMVRKVNWQRETGANFHTVAIDDREVLAGAAKLTGKESPEVAKEKINQACERYNKGDKTGFDMSKRKYCYKRGIAGSAQISNMQECKNMGEVKKLMNMPEKELPPKAQRTDNKPTTSSTGTKAAITDGKWKAGKDDKGKFFKNAKTGEVVRAKK